MGIPCEVGILEVLGNVSIDYVNITHGSLLVVPVGDDFSIIQQEIVMMKDCRHANIVQYFGSYLRRDKLWICMEYCGGNSLQDIYNGE